MENERKLKTAEMRMLRMLCGKTLKDEINNEKIREMTGVEIGRVSERAKVAMVGACEENG